MNALVDDQPQAFTTALIPLIALPVLCWITTRTLREPCSVQIGTHREGEMSESR